MTIRKYLLMLFLGVSIFSCKSNQGSEQIDTNLLTNDIVTDKRYLSPEEVSDIIINEDPGYMLIDVRTNEESSSFSLPGSMNVPWESIANSQDKLDCEKYSLVFYSNNDVLSERAWFLTRQLGCK